MADPRDYIVSINGQEETDRSGTADTRPFLSVLFACCAIYLRIYRNAAGTAYEGRCPRCGKVARFVVGPQGTGQRSFIVR